MLKWEHFFASSSVNFSTVVIGVLSGRVRCLRVLVWVCGVSVFAVLSRVGLGDSRCVAEQLCRLCFPSLVEVNVWFML